MLGMPTGLGVSWISFNYYFLRMSGNGFYLFGEFKLGYYNYDWYLHKFVINCSIDAYSYCWLVFLRWFLL